MCDGIANVFANGCSLREMPGQAGHDKKLGRKCSENKAGHDEKLVGVARETRRT